MAEGEPAGPVQVAQSLVGGSLNVRRDENVIIETWNHTLAYATACVVEVRRRGAHPILLLEDEAAYWRSIDLAPSIGRWAHVGAHEWAALARSKAYVFFPGPADMPRFRSLPSEHLEQLLGYGGEWYARARRAHLRGVRSVLGYVSEPQAEQWGVSPATWRNQIVRATVESDVAEVRRTAAHVASGLRRGKVVRITGPNGTDLTLRLRGRAPVVDDGVVTPEDVRAGQNLTVSPPGAVAVAIDERSAEGTFIASRPSFAGFGRLEGGQWEARQGRLVNAWFTEGQSAFEERYATAPRGKDVVSFISIGVNPALEGGVPRVEDQELGAVTLAVGGNAGYGGSNRSAFHAWIVLGEATVAVDGAPLVDRGHVL